MPTGIDHIVIAVDDLEQTIADYTAAGFTVTPGGEHKGGASRNALVTFQDGAYFELIAFAPDKPHGTHWKETLTQGEGLVDYALRTDDLAREVKALRAAGLDANDPKDGGRFRPDGQRVDWQTLRFGAGTGPSALPFYCHDLTERSLRVPGGEASAHANGVTGVAGITVVVLDLEARSREFRALTGSDGEDVASPIDGAVRARRFPVGSAAGSAWIELVEPAEGGSELRTYLEQRGELPYEVTLVSPDGQGELLSARANTHGARLRVTQGAAVPA
jgi:catechol 2,3-dioxygenase-like lactoylglutathione lyase family enzyme